MTKKIVINLLKVSVTGVILYLMFKKFNVGWTDIRQAFGHQPTWFIAALLAQCGAIFFSIQRWRILLNGQDLNVPMGHAVNTFLVGRFLGTFTPTGVGLEAYKAYDIARYTGAAEASVSVVLIEKMIGTFFSLGLLVLITLPFFIDAFNTLFLLVFGAFFATLLIMALVLLFAPGLIRILLNIPMPQKQRITAIVTRMVDALTVYSSRRGHLFMAVVMGLGVYMCWFLTYYANNLALGAGLSFLEVFKVGPLTQIATMIPLSIAGIGLREGAFMGLLDTLGVTRGAGVNTTAMMLSATMVYFVSISLNVVGAVIFLLRRTDYRQRIADMKATNAASKKTNIH